MKAKKRTDYWLLKVWWNRRVIYGPYAGQEIAESQIPKVVRGGPERYTVLKTVRSVRLVRRAGGVTSVEK